MRDQLEYWSVVSVRAVARRLPEALVRGWGALLGVMFYAIDRPHRRVTLANLEQCFPNRPAHERRRSARAEGELQGYQFQPAWESVASAISRRVEPSPSGTGTPASWHDSSRVRS